MDIGRRDIIVVTATTAIGFVGNVISYSVKLPKSRDHKFSFEFPRGIELTYVLVTGFIAGVLINKALSLIEDSMKTNEERLLDEAYVQARKKAQQGVVKNRNPLIEWIS